MNKNQGCFHKFKVQAFCMFLSWKDPFSSSVGHEFANKPYHIYIYMCVYVCICISRLHFCNIDVSTAVCISGMFFWFVTPCSFIYGCQLFGGTCCLHLHVSWLQLWISPRARRLWPVYSYFIQFSHTVCPYSEASFSLTLGVTSYPVVAPCVSNRRSEEKKAVRISYRQAHCCKKCVDV